MIFSKLKTSALALGTVCSASFLSLVNSAQAAQLVNDSTPAYYNQSIGDLYPGTPTNPQAQYFPGPNVSTGDPTATFTTPPNLSAVTNLGDWFSNPITAVINGFWSEPQVIPRNWEINDETAIIYEIDGGSSGISNLIGNFGVDNGIYVWVNGQFKFGAIRPGGAVAFEYSNIDFGNLAPGANYIQVLREDHGRANGYTVSITGDINAQSVPEPSSLLGIGVVVGLGALSAKNKKRLKS